MTRLISGVYRNLKKPVQGEIFTAIEVPDSIYKLEIVAVSKNWDKIEDPELADDPDWFATDVHDDYIWDGRYHAPPDVYEEFAQLIIKQRKTECSSYEQFILKFRADIERAKKLIQLKPTEP
jgi:hypothetical protein